MRRLLSWIEGQPAQRVLAACVAAVFLIGFADVLTGAQFLLTLLYLVPISLAAWRGSWRDGIILAVVAVAALLISDLITPPAEVSALALLWNQLSRFAVFIFVVLLITNLRDARQHAERLARTDVLTGVANLFAFREVSTRELARSRRSGEPLTLLFLDIDGFKAVNDFHGHSTGDEVLRRIARALCYAARRNDLVARVGGDEFVVLMPSTGAREATQVIERVTSRLATIKRPDGSPLTCSIGAATHDPVSATLDEIMQEADQAMYRAKSRRAVSPSAPPDRARRPLRLLSPPTTSAPDAEAFGMDS